MGKEEILLSNSIAETLMLARAAESQYAKFEFRRAMDSTIEPEDEEEQIARVTLKYYIEKAYRDVGLLAERLGASQFRTDLKSAHAAHQKKGITTLEMMVGETIFYSPSLSEVDVCFDSLAILTNGRSTTGIDVFRNILKNSASIVADANIEPNSEADVRREIFRVLNYCFDDAVREMSLGHITKTYKPDLGVKSLMAAAEYKYATSESEMKKSIDDIYTDMKGYSGHSEWRNFFAVFYTTEPILHQDKLEAQFREVKADLNWEPIIVVGKGGRKPK